MSDLITDAKDERLINARCSCDDFADSECRVHSVAWVSLRAVLVGADRLREKLANKHQEIEKHLSANHRLILSNSDARMENQQLRTELSRLRAIAALAKERDEARTLSIESHADAVRAVAQQLVEIRKCEDLEQQVKNLEQYMLRGVAFRDELQGRIKELEGERDRWYGEAQGRQIEINKLRAYSERLESYATHRAGK